MLAPNQLTEFIQQKLVRPALGFLNQGITPRKLSLTIALGIIIGMLPIFGVATALCAVAALTLRLNMAAIQLTHYAAAPLQLVMLVPFIRLGGLVFHASPVPFSFTQLYQMFSNDALATFQSLGFTFFLGFTGWLLVSIPLAIFLYYFTLPIFKRLSSSSGGSAVQA
jgi:uncharacterized protein (DUF2062 family)